MEDQFLIDEIRRLKKEKNAVILAHNYQIPEIQEVADIVGDSLKLSQEAARTEAETIVFCGVHFMAESAKILSPTKKVLLPARDAGCPMADMITADALKTLKAEHPGVPVVCYVNSSAEVKAECDITCTSSNAVKVVESLKADQIIFAPDRNLGAYVQSLVPQTTLINWDGFCITHERIREEEIIAVKGAKPGVKILVHPECNPFIVKHADFVGSTSAIIDYVKNAPDTQFVIGTEMGILHALRKENPEKTFYLLSPTLICYNMKKTTLNDVYLALRDDQYEIHVEESIRLKAYAALKRMIEIF